MVSTVSYSAPNLTTVLPLDYDGKQCVDGVTAQNCNSMIGS